MDPIGFKLGILYQKKSELVFTQNQTSLPKNSRKIHPVGPLVEQKQTNITFHCTRFLGTLILSSYNHPSQKENCRDNSLQVAFKVNYIRKTRVFLHILREKPQKNIFSPTVSIQASQRFQDWFLEQA